MSGLLIRELILRGDVARCLIVAPGSLVEQWQDELWDKFGLVIVDEAHKMSAHRYGDELRRTRRFKLGEVLRDSTRHFLLLTATPHNGKNEDFLAFMTLV